MAGDAVVDDFPFVGGDASLDLVNTAVHRTQPQGANELLTSGTQARRWFVRAGLLSEREAAQVDEDTLLHSTLRLRNALDAIYRPLARKKPDQAGTARGLTTLNALLSQGRERLEVTQVLSGDVGSAQSKRAAQPIFAQNSHFEMLGPVDPNVRLARHAADLLGRLEARRLKECQNPDCGLLFYDDSRNVSRRWCSMDGCGNQQKQARHRRRACHSSHTSKGISSPR